MYDRSTALISQPCVESSVQLCGHEYYQKYEKTPSNLGDEGKARLETAAKERNWHTSLNDRDCGWDVSFPQERVQADVTGGSMLCIGKRE